MKIATLVVGLLLSWIAFGSTTSIVLVRHAEKQAGVADPDFTQAGLARAQSLMKLGEVFEVQGVYSSSAKRAKQTAQPLADSLGLSVESLMERPDALLADILARHAGKTVLVVGHSDTIPAFIDFLRNDLNLGFIDEADFSNMYIIHVDEDSGGRAVHRYRYGPGPDASLKLVPVSVVE